MTDTKDEVEHTEFTFSELDECAKEYARNKYRVGNCYHNWWDCIYTDAQEIGALIGITIYNRNERTVGGATVATPAIHFSGFSCQGDGACFDGRYDYKPNAVGAVTAHTGGTCTDVIRIAELLTAIQVTAKMTYGCTIKAHISDTMNVECSFDDDELYEDLQEDEKITHLLRSFANWIYSYLEAEYDYLNSNEVIDECLKDGLTFDEYGAAI